LSSIADKINDFRQRISRAELDYGRKPNSVTLLAVSKTQPVEAIEAAVKAGQKIFGENYVQEALAKMEALRKYHLEWHFIGAIQSNKTQAIAENFAWVHSVDRLSIAKRLANQRPKELPPLNVCIQVNVSEEKNKAGIHLSALTELAMTVNELEHLRLRGLMTIPAIYETFDQQKAVYEKLAQAQRELIKRGLSLDTLSMGMTQDMAAAIAAGSTMVRIGTGIFGARK
jgi:pyridoxal phosphate enzyme (YggS family)